MNFFHILNLEKFQHFENFEIISYTQFLDIWIKQNIFFLLIAIYYGKIKGYYAPCQYTCFLKKWLMGRDSAQTRPTTHVFKKHGCWAETRPTTHVF